MSANNDRDKEYLGFWELLQSVGAALLGVQSEAARRRDFSKGRPMHFILIGIAATLVFILTIAGIVRLVLQLAG